MPLNLDNFMNGLNGQKQDNKQTTKSPSQTNDIWGNLNKKQEEEKKRAAEQAAQKKKQQEQKKTSSKNKDLTPKPKKKEESFKDKYIYGPQEWVYNHTLAPVEKTVNRFLVNVNDSMMFGQFKKNEDVGKKIGMEAPKFVQEASKKPTNKFEKGVDVAGQFVGSALPIGTSYKIANPLLKPIMNPLLKEGEQLAARKLIANSIRGGTSMGIYGTVREGIDEVLHPNDGTFKDRAKNVGMDMAYGATFDPAFSIVGTGFKKGMQAASNKAMQNMLPTSKQVEEALMNAAKEHKGNNALPISKPKVPDWRNNSSDLLPPLMPKTPPKPEVPKIGNPKPLEEMGKPETQKGGSTNQANSSNLNGHQQGAPTVSELQTVKLNQPLTEMSKDELEKIHALLTDEETIKVLTSKDPNRINDINADVATVEKLLNTKDTSPKADTSHIDKEIETLTSQMEQMKNQPKPKTKTQIDDELRSLDINDAYLHSSRKNKQISDEEYWRRSQENEAKRQSLLNQKNSYTVNVPDELKYKWNNETRAYELGDYKVKKAYGGGYSLTKGDLKLEFRTQDEAIRAMQDLHAKDNGIPAVNWDKDGVLRWSSKRNPDKNGWGWDITAGEYNIERASKDKWILQKGDETIGHYKTETKAREEAQRHYDKNNVTNPKDNSTEITSMEQRINELRQQKETLLNPPKTEPKPIEQVPVTEINGNTTQHPVKPTKPQQQTETVANTNTSQEPPNNGNTPNTKPQDPKANERSFPYTVLKSDKLTPEVRARIEQFEKVYKPMSNKELVQQANEFIAGNGIEKAYQFVKNADRLDPRHIAVGQRLIDELSKAKGQEDKVLDLIEKLSESGTRHGQSVQSFSLYNRLSVEGQLLRVQRHINRINEKVGNPEKAVTLTEENVKDITHAAEGLKTMTGQMEQANNVINIMDKIKKGQQATDDELELVRSFVEDAKKFVKDLDPAASPKEPKLPKDTRTRDKVITFMDAKEQLAKEELKKIFGRANSMPVDAIYHLSVIGASKIAKGTVKLADFSEEMVKEFGEQIRPYIKQIYNKAVDTFNLQSESMTKQRLSEVEKITNKALKDKNIDVDQADAIREFAKRIGQMSGDARLDHSMELQSILSALEVPTFGQKLSSLQTIGQLLNPKTMVRNFLGNEMFWRVEQVSKLLMTPIDIARSKITGGERTITFISHNQGQYWKNWLSGAKAGWKGQNPMGLTSIYDIGPASFRSKWNPLTYLEKTLGATLRSFDNAAYMRAYNKTLGELATLKAINEGLTGQAKKEAIARYIREADQNMIDMADQYGKYVTFQDNTPLAKGLTKFKKGLNKMTGSEHFGLGDLIMKYPKTPGNLVMRALEYSPAGFLRTAKILMQIRKTASHTLTKQATEALTRAIIGTGGLSIMGYFLADKGILTSAGSKDSEINALQKQAGVQANSVNITALQRYIASGFNPDAASVKKGDTFVSYDWAQPLSIAVALGTGMSQSKKDNGELNLYDSTKAGLNSAADTVINASVLKGLKDLVTSYPGQGWADKLSSTVEGAVGSFVPTLSNQARQLSDNTTRSTYDPNLLPTIGNKTINRIPGLDKKLPPAYDTLGRPKETYQGGSNNLWNVLMNPSFVSQYNPSPEAQYLLEYINQTGDTSVAPRIAPKKLDNVPLTGQQQADLQRIQGEETQRLVQNLLPRLQASNNQEKIHKALTDILEKAGKKGRKEVRQGMNR